MEKFALISKIQIDGTEPARYNSIAIDLENIPGIKRASVSNTASFERELSSAVNPLIDGEEITNSRTMHREITIDFVYDYTVAPEKVDEYIYSKLSFALGNGRMPFGNCKLILKKTDVVNKYLDVTIKSIQRTVYTKDPTLQMVLHGAAYWYGEEEEVNLAQYQVSLSSGVYSYSNIPAFKGDVPVPFNIEFIIDDNSEQYDYSAATLELWFGTQRSTVLFFAANAFTIPVLSGTEKVSIFFEIGGRNPRGLLALIKENPPVPVNVIGKMKSNQQKITPGVQLTGRSITYISPGTVPTYRQNIIITYTPLYIR